MAGTAALALAAAATLLAGCAPLVLGGAVIGTGLVVTDRRTAGTQLEDQSIEFKAAARVKDLATLGHVNVVSYNRNLLITGEVPDEREKQRVAQAVGTIENVRGVVNELGVGGNSSLASRSNDALIGAKVKASFIDAKDLQANAIKVVVERAIVYLLGRVAEREAARAVEVARAVPGVVKVVQVFEILSEQELAEALKGVATPPAAAASVPR